MADLIQIDPHQFRGSKDSLEHVKSLTPEQWGLPKKFNRWRYGQPELVCASIDSPTRHHVNCAPTGTGKSPAYVTHAVMSGARTVILTSTLGLQTQNLDDFSAIGMVDIRGRSNYKCLGYKYLNCDEGHPKCHVCKEGGCPRDIALRKAQASQLVITNYPFWMSVHKYGDGIGDVDLLILDEAHDAVDQLASFMAVTLSVDDISRSWRFITQTAHGTKLENMCRDGIEMPEGEELATWISWAGDTIKPYTKLIEACQAGEDGSPAMINLPNHEHAMKDFAITKRVQSALLAIATQCKPETWIAEVSSSGGGVRFDPIWPAMYNTHLFQDVRKVVFYSATILPKTMALLGVPKDTYTYSEFESSFDPRRSPIYHIPTARLSFRSSDGDWRLAVARTDQITRMREDRKGLVVTGSFERQKLYRKNSDYAEFIHYNSDSIARVIDGKTIAKVVKEFKAAPPPALLVSPSVTTGFDFPGDECRFLVMLKVPFPDTRSKVMQKRKQLDPDYYNYLTMVDIVQIFGRGTRSAEDWCEYFCVDDNFVWFMRQNTHHMTKAFKTRALLNGYVRTMMTIPAAMEW